MSFEEENEKKRNRDERKKNVVKRYRVNCSDEVFYVGSLDLLDPYSGEHVYTPSKKQLEDLETKELMASEQSDDFQDNSFQDETATIPTTDAPSAAADEEMLLANEIYQRLMAEAAADESAKQAEIEALLREQEASSEDYNEATGSYSGLYGKKPMTQSEEDALASIMGANSSFNKSIEDLIAENSGDDKK